LEIGADVGLERRWVADHGLPVVVAQPGVFVDEFDAVPAGRGRAWLRARFRRGLRKGVLLWVHGVRNRRLGASAGVLLRARRRQPPPESNLVSEASSGSPQQTHA